MLVDHCIKEIENGEMIGFPSKGPSNDQVASLFFLR